MWIAYMYNCWVFFLMEKRVIKCLVMSLLMPGHKIILNTQYCWTIFTLLHIKGHFLNDLSSLYNFESHTYLNVI